MKVLDNIKENLEDTHDILLKTLGIISRLKNNAPSD